MTASELIDLTLEEIAKDYQTETLPWMKGNKPNDWGSMLTLERSINKTALDGNLNGLREVLSEYQRLILAMVKDLKPRLPTVDKEH